MAIITENSCQRFSMYQAPYWLTKFNPFLGILPYNYYLLKNRITFYSLTVLYMGIIYFDYLHPLHPPTPPKYSLHSPSPFMPPLYPPPYFVTHWVEAELLSFEEMTHPLGMILGLPCAGNPPCTKFMSSMACHIQRTAFCSPPPHSPGPTFFLLPLQTCSLKLLPVKIDTNIPLRD